MKPAPALAAFAVCVGLVALPPRRASAQADECGEPARPWIKVTFVGRWSPGPSSADVMTQLRAGLSVRGIDACTTAPQARPPATATLTIAPSESGAVTLTIEVTDAITAKRVGRDIDLRGIPTDGQALAVAVDADELLRATWAELAMKDAPAPRVVIPPAVQQTVASSIGVAPAAEPTPSRVHLGLYGAAAHSTGGLTFFGGDVASEVWFAPRVGALLSLGYRTTPLVGTSLGELRVTAGHAGLGGLVALTSRRAKAGLDLGLSADVLLVHLAPSARAGATGHALNDWALDATGMLRGWIAIAPRLYGHLEAGVSLPLRSVSAASDNQAFTSTNGVGLMGSLGLSFPL